MCNNESNGNDAELAQLRAQEAARQAAIDAAWKAKQAAAAAAGQALASQAQTDATNAENQRKGRRRGGISTVVSGALGDPNFGGSVSLSGLSAGGGPSNFTRLG